MKKKILIVDDQPGIRLLLKDVFSLGGYQITKAKDGLEAFEKISAERFDLILLDYHLPLLTGQEVLDKMKQLDIVVPVLVMSGSTEQLQKMALHSEDHIKFIPKPFNIVEISELVKSMIGS